MLTSKKHVLPFLAACVVTVGCQTTSQIANKPIPEQLPAMEAFSSRTQMLQAEAEIKRQLLDDPNDAVAFWKLAQLYERQGLLFSASQAYERSLALAPGLLECQVGFAELLARRGEKTRALTIANKVLDTDKKQGGAHYLRGKLLREMGRNDEAVQAFRSGWECRPPSIDAGYALAQWELERGNVASAGDHLKLCLIYAPNRSDIRETLAETLTKHGRRDEAIAAWEHIANSGDGGSRPYFELARLYQERGDQDLAFVSLDRGERISPGSEEIKTIRKHINKPVSPPIVESTEFRPLIAHSRQ